MNDKLRLVPDPVPSLPTHDVFDQWSRVQMLRDTFGSELKGDDELVLFAQLVPMLAEPARLLAELRPDMDDGRAEGIKCGAAISLEWMAAACLEVAGRLRR